MYVKKKKSTMLFVLIFLMGLNGIYAKASDIQYIRVGLKSLYSGVSSISIENKKIAIGYCIDSNYEEDVILESNNGFKIQPATGYYYICTKSYQTYSDAFTVAQTIQKLGIDAYAAITYHNIYRVYLGGGSRAKAQEQYSIAKGRLGLTYSAIKSDNQYRMIVKLSDSQFLIDIDNNKAYPQFVAKPDGSQETILNLGDRCYRGRMEIGRYEKTNLTAINVISIEDYLYGVVPCEMENSWHMEALKAQAVCARGYAYLKSGYRSESDLDTPYKLCDTTSSQIYRGYLAEKDRTSKAVDLTAGEMVRYHNKPVSTYYFSTSGGATEAAEDVWSGAYPYLLNVPDLYESSPEKAPWIVTMTKKEISDKLSKKGIQIGTVIQVFPEILTQSGRVFSLKIKGSKGSASLQKETVRTALGLNSTKFKVVKYGDKPDLVVMKSFKKVVTKQIRNAYVIDGTKKVKKASSTIEQYIALSKDNRTNFARSAPTNKNTFLFVGQGYGHGIGMSQSGANGMAKAGFTYKQILSHYFTGVTIN